MSAHEHGGILLQGDTLGAYLLVNVGTGLWLVAYALAIVYGFKYRTYGIPWVAIALNFTWEALATFLWKAPFAVWHYGAIFWLVVDVVIVWQLVWYGRGSQTVPELRRWFHPLVVASFALALVGQYAFARFFDDWLGFVDSYLVNLTMSILFIFMFIVRRDAGPLVLGVAWAKMFGTGLISVGLVRMFPMLYPGRRSYLLMYVLYAACFLIDALYVAVLHRARRALQPRSA